MQLQGYIIEKYNCMKNAYTCNRLAAEAEKADVDLKIIGLYDTMVCGDALPGCGDAEKCCGTVRSGGSAICSSGGVGHDSGRVILNCGEVLKPRDFIINRYKWGKLKEEINLLAARSYNEIGAYDIYINKYEQVKRLHSDAFEMPGYCMCTAMIPYETLAYRLGTPFVAKGLESSMGEEVLLIRGKEEYDALTTRYSRDKEWLFEEFIETSFGRDMRFYSIRGRVAACMQRRSNGDFRANVALGAGVEPYEITPAIRQIAADIYAQTKLDFLGIDLLFGKDKPYFCEINVMPGLEGIEKASGVNVAAMIIETIKGDFAGE